MGGQQIKNNDTNEGRAEKHPAVRWRHRPHAKIHNPQSLASVITIFTLPGQLLYFCSRKCCLSVHYTGTVNRKRVGEQEATIPSLRNAV
ncbi:hypothetical protein DdX_01229 [Ditylenchus destructor]|uniref:Uncharacterized protein n=1 Tax=Ditylenchus destructor TaxID=166010 RepID=A0AAD4NK64_9BILA|nr:hypothetical protein DdX_01229 [Ditylenchus destructor]